MYGSTTTGMVVVGSMVGRVPGTRYLVPVPYHHTIPAAAAAAAAARYWYEQVPAGTILTVLVPYHSSYTQQTRRIQYHTGSIIFSHEHHY
jgi:hypothetical protein